MKNYVIAAALVVGLSAAAQAMYFENQTGQTVIFSLTTDDSILPQKFFPVRTEDQDEHDVFVEANTSKKVSMKGLLEQMQAHACQHGGVYNLHVGARPEPQAAPHHWVLGKAVQITPTCDLSDVDDMTFIYDGKSCWLKEEK